MAALDFPSSPAVNQLYVAGNGVTYQWNGTMWLPVGGSSSIYIGDVPPNTPGPGQFWFNATLATLYIWYNDGNSTQWVPTNPVPAPAVVPTIVPTGLLQAKIIRVVNVVTGTPASSLATNDTLPVITHGIELMTLAITPLSAASRLIVEADVYMSQAGAPGLSIAALFQDAITNALSAGITRYPTASGMMPIHVSWDAISGSLTPRTFRIRGIANQAGAITMNGEGGVRVGGGALSSTIKIMEVLP